MTGKDKLRLAMEITKGVMCLHKKGIIHRDLVNIPKAMFPTNFELVFILTNILEFLQYFGSRASNKNCGSRAI